jgi:hypothetical protein
MFKSLKKFLYGERRSCVIGMPPYYIGSLYINVNSPSFYKLTGPGKVTVYISDVTVMAIDATGVELNIAQLLIYLGRFPIEGMLVVKGVVKLSTNISTLAQLITSPKRMLFDEELPMTIALVETNNVLYLHTQDGVSKMDGTYPCNETFLGLDAFVITSNVTVLPGVLLC